MVTRYFFFFVEKRELSLKFHRFTGAASLPPFDRFEMRTNQKSAT